MSRAVLATAHANIALVKYWGKKDSQRNDPATPSLSLALDVLRTETRIEQLEGSGDLPGADLVELDGQPAGEKTTRRIRAYLEAWRQEGLIAGHFRISSVNHFPTAAGLASSASGFAALAAGLAAFAKKKIPRREISRLARMGSGSAARSVPGGIAALPAGHQAAARRILPPEKTPWGMVVAVVEAPPKSVGSTEGMIRSRLASPYFNAWVATARKDYRRMLRAVKELDLATVGHHTENNALAMHACMIATRPRLMYWSAATLELLRCVQVWREQGLEAYATIDAGPHVCFLARREELALVAAEVEKVSGVQRVLVGLPAPGAEVVPCS